jgi:hypothetical protein
MPEIRNIAILKTVAADNDFLVLQSPEGETYRITKADLLKGLSSGTSVTDSDNLFSSVILLLSNDGTVISDLSKLKNSIANNGITFSDINKFSPKSLRFEGGTNIITIPNSSSFNLKDEDFTVENWIYPTFLDNNPRYILSKVGDLSNNANRGYGLNINSSGFQWYWTIDGINDYSINFPCTIPINEWSHIAVSRKKDIASNTNTLYGLFRGNLISSVSHTATYFNSSASITIGSFGGYAANGYPQLSFIGNIEKNGLRLTKVCRYTSSFTPSNKAFPVS